MCLRPLWVSNLPCCAVGGEELASFLGLASSSSLAHALTFSGRLASSPWDMSLSVLAPIQLASLVARGLATRAVLLALSPYNPTPSSTGRSTKRTFPPPEEVKSEPVPKEPSEVASDPCRWSGILVCVTVGGLQDCPPASRFAATARGLTGTAGSDSCVPIWRGQVLLCTCLEGVTYSLVVPPPTAVNSSPR